MKSRSGVRVPRGWRTVASGCLILLVGAGAVVSEEETPLLSEKALLSEWTNSVEQTSSERLGADSKRKNEAAYEENPLVTRLAQEGYRAIKEGDEESGLQLFHKALTLDPHSRQARFGLGTAYIQLSRYQDAADVLTALSVDFPRDYMLRNNLAWMYATATDPSFRSGEKAIALAREALLLAANDYHVWSTLSEAHFVAGNFKEAERAALEALRLATQARVPRDQRQDYELQVRKCRKAANALSVRD